ncbi:hypothetical protein BDV19DRAFT_397380 [Aspergillus venezuelensis]
MSYRSIYPPLKIPHTNILTYLYPPNEPPSTKPIWIDAANPTKSLSPQQMLSWVRRLAFGLDRLNIPKGEVVMIVSTNQLFVPMAYQAIAGSGRIFSGANPAYTPSELEYQIRNTGAKLLLAHPSVIGNALEAGTRAGLGKERIFLFTDGDVTGPIEGVHDWRTMIGSEEEGETWRWDEMDDTAAETVATINYSSGTTGLPKGVCVSHYNLIANVEQTVFMRNQGSSSGSAAVDAGLEERWVGFLPLYHAYGQLYACLMAPKLNFPIFIMRKFVFEDFLATIQTHRITHLQVAPPILIMLDKRPESAKYDLTSVRNILCGAAPLSQDLQNNIQNRFNLSVVQGWGMTEVTCGAVHVPGKAHDETGSVGLLDPNCECKLIGDDGRIAQPGAPGEMYIRGPNVCLRYWRNEQATAESLDGEGWLKTGDVAVVKNDWFWIVDRKKELIKVNALQVVPAELEAVLLEHDAIADAGVVGVLVAESEERPRGYIRLKEGRQLTAEDVQAYMRKRIAKHKQLAGGVKIVDDIPRLASGKIQRAVLRQWAAQEMKASRAKL